MREPLLFCHQWQSFHWLSLREILSLIDVDIASFVAQEAVRVCSCLGASEQTIRVMQEWTLIPRMLSGNNDAGYEH